MKIGDILVRKVDWRKFRVVEFDKDLNLYFIEDLEGDTKKDTFIEKSDVVDLTSSVHTTNKIKSLMDKDYDKSRY